MKTTHVTIPAIIALLSCLTSGCVSHTTIKDEPRRSVRFSSPQAAQIFYDAYLSAASPKGRGSVNVYVALPYQHETVSTDNVLFNAAVQTADSNHNAVISTEEARAFAVQQRTSKLALSSCPR
jgi:hypothetical protein